MKFLYAVLAVAFLLAVASGGYYLWALNKKPASTTPVATTPSAAPSTGKPLVDVSSKGWQTVKNYYDKYPGLIWYTSFILEFNGKFQSSKEGVFTLTDLQGQNPLQLNLGSQNVVFIEAPVESAGSVRQITATDLKVGDRVLVKVEINAVSGNFRVLTITRVRQ